jgi:hypothetical protein
MKEKAIMKKTLSGQEKSVHGPSRAGDRHGCCAADPTAAPYSGRSPIVGKILLAVAGIVSAACAVQAAAAAAADAFAAQRAEFAAYYRQITGTDPLEGLVRFEIDPKVSKRGRDAYTIRSGTRLSPMAGTREARRHPAVVITGSNTRSVWYGLYDLLERRGGCRWFWDGDVVPKKETIDLTGLDVYEEAHFEYRAIRYFAHRGLTRFQAEHWGLDDWKKEINWILKRRLNTFMLRIGQDDLFQLAFPDVCAYPDPSQPLPGAGKAFRDRSLFWSLQYRGQLRRNLQKYAFERGLMVPEDFGTMTHWYSRTPNDFIAKKNPPSLPRAGTNYSEHNEQVWDIRDDKWVDEYWKMTKASVASYGKGAPEPRLLHTIGLGERMCYRDRKANFALKVEALEKFLSRAHRDYPDSNVLIAGWDFFFTWKPDEVRALLPKLDPKRDIIWDYEADWPGRNNFTKWGVVGKFPYTYSIFLAYEKALDARANYPLIEKRQKIVQNDPFCKGYILWPESSHTDPLALRYFTANAWSSKPVSHKDVLTELCASRYGKSAAQMKAAWETALPVSWLRNWDGNCVRAILTFGGAGANNAKRIAAWKKPVAAACDAFELLQNVHWRDPFVHRDAVDVARMVLDRLISLRIWEFSRDYFLWRSNRVPDSGFASNLVARAANVAALCDKMADLLALHTDYSLWESYQRLDSIERIRYPDFSKTLFDNASCDYCQSHQYEFARHWYAAHTRDVAERVAKIVAAGDRQAVIRTNVEARRRALKARALESLKPTLPRTEENLRTVIREIAQLAKNPTCDPALSRPFAKPLKSAAK